MMPITTFIFCVFAIAIFFLIAAISAHKDSPDDLASLAYALDFIMKLAFSALALYGAIYFLKSNL